MSALTNSDDRVKLWGFWLSLGLVTAMAAILLRVVLVLTPSAPSSALHAAPAAGHAAAGASFSGAPR